MRIEDYFNRIRDIIELFPIIHLSNITYDKRSSHVGFIRGHLHFIDGSVLEWREFIDVEITQDRLMYVYHYMDINYNMVFRYDNTGHHKQLNLSTYPGHKHEGNENNVLPSESVDLHEVLEEIRNIVKLP